MRRIACVLMSALVACLAVNAADDKGTVIAFDDLKSTLPANWKASTEKKPLRWMTFVVPRAQGDDADADLALFMGLAGTKKDNLARWQGQFDPPEGKKISDTTKVEDIKVAGCDVMYVDIQGTYFDGPPMLPKARKKRLPNYRMLAVQFEGPDNKYHIKLIGPAKTVAEHKKGFDEWVKGFKK
jgi:hypothetical protein